MLELSQGYLSRRLVDIDVTGLGLFYTRRKGSDVFGKTDIGLSAEPGVRYRDRAFGTGAR